MDQTELELFKTEGLESRLRNKLSPVKTLFHCIAMYAKTEDSVLLLNWLSAAEKQYNISLDSFAVMHELAQQSNNTQLEKKLSEFAFLFARCSEFLDQKKDDLRKHKAFLFSSKVEQYDTWIEEIIATAKSTPRPPS